MTHKLINTENYLLVVGQPEEGINPKVKYFDDKVDVNNIYCSTKFLDDNTFEYRFISGINNDYRIVQKIIAHLPLNNSPILEGVDLLPPLEDEVEKLANELWKASDDRTGSAPYIYSLGVEHGYNKAKEKYKYTEEDIEIAIKKAVKLGNLHDPIKAVRDITYSLQQLKMPVGFECDMVKGLPIHNSNNVNVKVLIPTKQNTKINSQGLTKWVGEYIYG